jgi:hypothetical protein
MADIKIFVEGVADVKFLSDYINYIAPNFKFAKESIIDTGGWTNIDSQKENKEHWNLDSEFLIPLKEFLLNYI